MRKLLLVLAVLATFSCSKEEIEMPQECTKVPNCGLIEQKRWIISTNQFRLYVGTYYGTYTRSVIVTEDVFFSYEIGDEYCHELTCAENLQ